MYFFLEYVLKCSGLVEIRSKGLAAAGPAGDAQPVSRPERQLVSFVPFLRENSIFQKHSPPRISRFSCFLSSKGLPRFQLTIFSSPEEQVGKRKGME